MKNGEEQNYEADVNGTLHLVLDRKHFVSVTRLSHRERCCFPVVLLVWYRKEDGSPGAIKWMHSSGACKDATLLLEDMAIRPGNHDCIPSDPSAISEMLYEAGRFNNQVKCGNNGAWTLLPATPLSYVPKVRIVDSDVLSDLDASLDRCTKLMFNAASVPASLVSAQPNNPPLGRFPCRTQN